MTLFAAADAVGAARSRGARAGLAVAIGLAVAAVVIETPSGQSAIYHVDIKNSRCSTGAIVYVRYGRAINSTTLVNRLREEKSVLIVPGDHFGMDGYLRLGFGEPAAYNHQGLERLRELLASLPEGAEIGRRPPRTPSLA